MHLPATSGNSLLAASCQAHGLDDAVVDSFPSRPGSQPWNRIGTLREQLARARAGRQSPRERVRSRLLELLADPITDIALAVVREVLAS